jgi:hypothetical protein
MSKDVAVAKKAVVAGTSDARMLAELILSCGHYPDVISVEDLQQIADRLSEVGQKVKRPWTWRYLRSVLSGTVGASKLLSDSILRLGALIDGVRREAVMGQAVTVRAMGSVKAGAVVLASSQPCANPACGLEFVPVVPWQKCHSRECARARAKIVGCQKHVRKPSEGGQHV